MFIDFNDERAKEHILRLITRNVKLNGWVAEMRLVVGVEDAVDVEVEVGEVEGGCLAGGEVGDGELLVTDHEEPIVAVR